MVGKFAIVIAGIMAVIIAVTVSVYASGWNSNEVKVGEGSEEGGVGEILVKNTNMIEAVIKSDGSWSATINDGKSGSYTIEGSGNSSIPISCDGNGEYSLSLRKLGETTGTLNVEVMKNGNVSQKSSTTSTSGLISISGTC
jgi:hypothetical protein